MWILVFQRLALEALFDIVYWPVWWYTGGLVYAGKKSLGLFAFGNEWLAPGIWLVNIFVPMYGQYDWPGRMISFVMRLFNVIARSLALGVWLLVCAALFALWLSVPPFIVMSILKSI